MIEIEFLEKLDDEIIEMLDNEFNKYAEMNGVKCDYKSFNFVAKENDKVVGIINGHSYYDEIHISDFIILEEYRKYGIGTKLFNEFKEYCKKNKIEELKVTASSKNINAIKFYQKNGFEEFETTLKMPLNN